MVNFQKETLADIADIGKSLTDIDWIGCNEFVIPTDEFLRLADVEYDDGFGSPEMPEDLVIVFHDGTYLDRREYDGSEWWAYHCTPKKPPMTITALRDLAADFRHQKRDYYKAAIAAERQDRLYHEPVPTPPRYRAGDIVILPGYGGQSAEVIDLPDQNDAAYLLRLNCDHLNHKAGDEVAVYEYAIDRQEKSAASLNHEANQVRGASAALSCSQNNLNQDHGDRKR